jgi:uncharacterized protein (TIGR00266 family)
MQHQITHGPSFSMLRVDLNPGETLVAEAGSMVARSESLQMAVKLNAGGSGGFLSKAGSLLIAIVRKFIGGESLVVNHFSGPSAGSIWIAPAMSGSILYRRLQGEKLVLSSGAYVASVGNVDVNMKFGGLSSILAKEGAFMLEVGGNGDLWFNSYGGIETVDLNGGTYIVDNGHLVGYEGNLQMTMTTAGKGLMGFAASGEGVVCKFSGSGRIYIQSRNVESLIGYVTRLLV